MICLFKRKKTLKLLGLLAFHINLKSIWLVFCAITFNILQKKAKPWEKYIPVLVNRDRNITFLTVSSSSYIQIQ